MTNHVFLLNSLGAGVVSCLLLMEYFNMCNCDEVSKANEVVLVGQQKQHSLG